MTPILRQNLRGAAAMALCLPFLLPLAGACVNGKLTPAAAQGLDLAFAALCPLEALASPAVAAACPGEELAFDMAIAAETVPPAAPAAPAADAGAPLAVALHRRGGPGEPPLVPIGVVPASHPRLPHLQRRALAIVGKQWPVNPWADAGAEGGSR